MKYSFAIIKNIELICFIPPNYIESYKKCIKNKLNEEKEIKLYNYLENNWFNKNSKIFNYYELFDKNLIEIKQHFFQQIILKKPYILNLIYIYYQKKNYKQFYIFFKKCFS